MDNLFQSLVAFQQKLQRADIASAVIGGVAVSIWGEPRVTRDVDIKVLLDRDESSRLLETIGSDYIALQPDPVEVLRRHGVLFVQDQLGTRLDILLADVTFDVAAIQRARPIEILPGEKVLVCSPEDLIIYKLISTRIRDHVDAESIVRRQGDNLDDDYVAGWLEQFEQAFDDSTLVAEYRQMRARHK